MMTFRSCFGILAGAVLTAGSLEATLIGYWPMDETDGTVAADMVGDADGVWQGNAGAITWLPDGEGIHGGAALLPNGTGNFFRVAGIPGMSGATKLTISLWIDPEADPNAYNGVFMSRDTDNGSRQNNWGVAQRRANPRSIDTRTNGAAVESTEVLDEGGFPVNDGLDDYEGTGPSFGWYHVVMVWDGDLGQQDIYINGKENTLGSSSETVIVSSGSWDIGNDRCCPNREFNGAIDDLAVWNEALTPEQIGQLFAKTLVPMDINPPTDNDGDGLTNDYESMFPGFLDPETADAGEDVDRVDGLIGGAPMPDGLTNLEEFENFTDPRNPDSDFDGVLDGAEVKTYGSNPLSDDSDGDFILDGEEVVLGVDGFITDPTKADTDGDGFSDDVEIADGTDPTDASDPAIEALPEDGLVHLWRFDETDGGTASDSVGGVSGEWVNFDPFDGFVFNLQWTDGQIGGAADLEGNFDDLGNYFELDVLTGLVGPANLTISAWVNPRSQTDTAYNGVFMTRGEGVGNENWGLAFEGNANFDFRIPTNDAGGSDGGTADGRAVPDGSWYHVVLTYDQITQNRVHYVNGVPVQNYTNTFPFDLTGVGWRIGSDENQPSRDFDGLLDDISVWDRALRQGEVRSIYENGKTGIGVGPVVVDPSGDDDFRITSVVRNGDGTVTIVWNSDPAPGTKYTILATPDLNLPFGNWLELEDNRETQGETTDYTTVAGAFPADARTFYFVVRLNPAAN